MEAGVRAISMRDLQRIADKAGDSAHTLVIAHLLLDENLELLQPECADAVQTKLMALAEHYRRRLPAGLKDAAAVGLLFGQPAVADTMPSNLGSK